MVNSIFSHSFQVLGVFLLIIHLLRFHNEIFKKEAITETIVAGIMFAIFLIPFPNPTPYWVILVRVVLIGIANVAFFNIRKRRLSRSGKANNGEQK